MISKLLSVSVFYLATMLPVDQVLLQTAGRVPPLAPLDTALLEQDTTAGAAAGRPPISNAREPPHGARRPDEDYEYPNGAAAGGTLRPLEDVVDYPADTRQPPPRQLHNFKPVDPEDYPSGPVHRPRPTGAAPAFDSSSEAGGHNDPIGPSSPPLAQRPRPSNFPLAAAAALPADQLQQRLQPQQVLLSQQQQLEESDFRPSPLAGLAGRSDRPDFGTTLRPTAANRPPPAEAGFVQGAAIAPQRPAISFQTAAPSNLRPLPELEEDNLDGNYEEDYIDDETEAPVRRPAAAPLPVPAHNVPRGPPRGEPPAPPVPQAPLSDADIKFPSFQNFKPIDFDDEPAVGPSAAAPRESPRATATATGPRNVAVSSTTAPALVFQTERIRPVLALDSVARRPVAVVDDDNDQLEDERLRSVEQQKKLDEEREAERQREIDRLNEIQRKKEKEQQQAEAERIRAQAEAEKARIRKEEAEKLKALEEAEKARLRKEEAARLADLERQREAESQARLEQERQAQLQLQHKIQLEKQREQEEKEKERQRLLLEQEEKERERQRLLLQQEEAAVAARQRKEQQDSRELEKQLLRERERLKEEEKQQQQQQQQPSQRPKAAESTTFGPFSAFRNFPQFPRDKESVEFQSLGGDHPSARPFQLPVSTSSAPTFDDLVLVDELEEEEDEEEAGPPPPRPSAPPTRPPPPPTFATTTSPRTFQPSAASPAPVRDPFPPPNFQSTFFNPFQSQQPQQQQQAGVRNQQPSFTFFGGQFGGSQPQHQQPASTFSFGQQQQPIRFPGQPQQQQFSTFSQRAPQAAEQPGNS